MTTSGPSGDQGGEHGGAMDKLKSVWREAIGSPRDDDGTRGDGRSEHRADTRAEGWDARPSGGAHPADARPDVSARTAGGMQPADTGTGPLAQQPPQHGAPQRAPQQPGPGPVPRQQQAAPAQAPVPQEQTVAAAAGAPAAHGAPGWGAAQAPPGGATDERAQQQVPRQPAQPYQAAAPQGAPQAAPQQAAPQQSAPQNGAAPGGAQPNGAHPNAAQQTPAQQTPAQQAPAQQAPARAEARPGSQGQSRQSDRPDSARPGATGSTAESATDRTEAATDRAGAPGTDKSHGRHELFDAEGSSSGTAGAAGMAGAAGVAAAASGTDRTAAPAGNGAAPAGATTGGQEVPADPNRFVPVDRAEGFAARWGEVKGDFVDEPRDAVRKADALVGEVLDEIAKVFTEQRSQLEHELDTDGTSTEDLRQAMHRYREFFERLLKI